MASTILPQAKRRLNTSPCTSCQSQIRRRTKDVRQRPDTHRFGLRPSSFVVPSHLLYTNIILRQRCRGGLRAAHIAQLRELKLVLKTIGIVVETVQHRGHPPREVLDAPDAPQA